jgi:hypothetical protein
LIANHDTRQVVTDPQARYYGTPVDDRSLTPGDRPRVAATHFDDWLRRTVAQK